MVQKRTLTPREKAIAHVKKHTVKEVPEQYFVNGLKASGYSKLGPNTEAVDFTTPKGTEFSLARDMMGIQFCKGGRLWPSMRGFASMEKAITHIRKHTDGAIAFFDSTEKGKTFNVIDVLFAAACTESAISPS